jgi:hypothetical protein
MDHVDQADLTEGALHGHGKTGAGLEVPVVHGEIPPVQGKGRRVDDRRTVPPTGLDDAR